ncbi:MAG: DNA-binding protein WhiA [Bacillota bacterium]
MSFCSDVKAEVARLLPQERCCQVAQMQGMICGAGTVRDQQVKLSTTTPHVARAAYRLATKLFGPIQPPRASKGKLTEETVWTLSLPAPPNEEMGARACCLKSFLRGAFLTGGYVAPPGKQYHAEVSCRDPRQVPRLRQALLKIGVKPGMCCKAGRTVLYLKGADEVAALLGAVGAHSALMEFENRRALNQLKNQVNRVVNMDTANAEKTVWAAEKQIEDIMLIDREVGLHRLSPRLQHVARLRLANPEASLNELANLATPPLTKSAVNHRMRKIHQIAADLAAKSVYEGAKDARKQE